MRQGHARQTEPELSALRQVHGDPFGATDNESNGALALRSPTLKTLREVGARQFLTIHFKRHHELVIGPTALKFTVVAKFYFITANPTPYAAEIFVSPGASRRFAHFADS